MKRGKVRPARPREWASELSWLLNKVSDAENSGWRQCRPCREAGKEGGAEGEKRQSAADRRENSSVSLVKTGRAELMKNDVEAGRQAGRE